MRRLLALSATAVSLALVTPASAASAPESGCTRELARRIALYDGPLESYPAFLAGTLAWYANCVV